MSKVFLLLLGSFLPIFCLFAQSYYVNPEFAALIGEEYSKYNSPIEGLYLSDKMFDVQEDKYVLRKFKDIAALDEHINENIPFFASCFEFQKENKLIFKRVRSKQSKKREWRHATAVDGINWSQIDDTHYILTVRVRYLSSNCNFLEKAIYTLSKDSTQEDVYILQRQEYLEFEHKH